MSVCLSVCLSVYHFLKFRIEANQANSQTLCYRKEEKKMLFNLPPEQILILIKNTRFWKCLKLQN